jgi:AraC-like DNA-binding protein
MTDTIEKAVARAIATMRSDFAEDITVEDLARSALFSKFHFTRVFRRTTGVSPARFLSAVRLEEAKRLLQSTSLSIAEISRHVGYHSVGTFSTRFTCSVGLPPTAYRRLGGVKPMFPHLQLAEFGSVQGHVWRASHLRGFIYLGLFPSRIPEGRPIRCAVLDRSGAFALDRVPVGTYYVLCCTMGGGTPDGEGQHRSAVGNCGPVTVRAGRTTTIADVYMKPGQPLDPPILLALSGAH